MVMNHLKINFRSLAVLYLRRLVDEFSPRGHGFDFCWMNVLPRLLRCSPVSVIPTIPYNLHHLNSALLRQASQ
jgi:hypothetical protein